MAKTCKWCGSLEHAQFYCRSKPLKPIKAQGKHAKKWMDTKAIWLERFKAPYYYCYLCGKPMTPSQLTLDHVIPRSRAPQLRYRLSNLKPCCMSCNLAKGSKVY